MTLDEFEQNIDNIGRELLNLTPILTRIGNEMTAELRNAAPVDTGALQSSISLEVKPQEFGISMLDYGAFQNYGVKSYEGKGDNDDQDIPTGFATQKYQFGTGNFSQGGRPWGAYYSGLNAKRWFNINDMTNEVTYRLQNAINNMIQ